MKQRKLLLFSHETTLSGAPIALLHLASWLQEHGYAPVVAAPEAGPISESLEKCGIEMILEPTFLTDPAHEKLHALCREYELVVANTLASWPAVRGARAANIPVLWYVHETLVARELIAKIPQLRPTLDLATLIVTPTQETARLYSGLTRTRIEVVPYGIPQPAVVRRAAPNDVVRFVCLGSYEPRKGQDILLQAVAQLSPEIRARSRFTCAGRVLEADFFANLERDAARLPNVELASDLDHAGSLQLLADADVLACASRDETMPISILEAMSLGKTVIGTDVGGISEWLRDGLNGCLVPSENPEALTSALALCTQNPELRQSWGAAAQRTFARHFTREAFGNRFAACLAQTSTPSTTTAARTYGQWVALYDTPTAGDAITLRRRLGALSKQPCISVLLPIYNPDLKLLGAALESVTSQSYPEWELCLADDASTDPAVRPFLEEAARREPRIKLTFRSQNGHISAASNSALELATGAWCALLDQDDALAEHAFAFVALEIAAHSEARLIYSDEDKIDLHGTRSNPFFKGDWNPELFHGQNYINHLGVYQTALLHEIGGFREGYEGSQDYDLASRCCDRIAPAQVRHIPRILYHWRMAPGSLAEKPHAKPYAREAARRVLRDHLQRLAVAGRVEPCPENDESHRVIYEIAEPAPLVSIIVPTRDRLQLLQRCVESVRSLTEYRAFEILIIDNGSTEAATQDYLQACVKRFGLRVLRDEGAFNFSRLNNRAADQARGEILAFLNNDIEVTEGAWLTEMVSHAMRAEVGAVGARLWRPDGTLQHGGVVLGLGGVAGHAHDRVPHGHPGYFNRAFLQQNCSAVTAACMLTRKSLFQQLGGFDETHLGINFNDIDYCVRVRAAGLQVVWTPYANLKHDESASRGHQASAEQRAQFLREATYMQATHGDALLHDPFYSPNLTLELPGYLTAFPPRRDYFGR